jgi:sarcosine oxidase subunit gamma
MADREVFRAEKIDKRAAVGLRSWSAAPIPAPSLVPPGLGGQVRLLTLGPREWVAVSDTITGPELHERLKQHLGGQEISAVDLSCGIKAISAQGSAARDVLSKGCGLDLHQRALPAGHCTRTRFAQLAVIVDCTSPAPCFELYVGRSYVDYLHAWLLDAAAEFL